MIVHPWDLSGVRETRRPNGQQNTEPHTRFTRGNVPDVRGRCQGHKESNQNSQIAFLLPLILFFFFPNFKIYIF